MKKTALYFVVMLIVTMTTALPLHAALPLAEFKRMSTPEYEGVLEMYVNAVGEGMLWASVALTDEKALYCIPKTTAPDYRRILTDEIKRKHYTPDSPIAYILLEGLKVTFPCGKR